MAGFDFTALLEKASKKKSYYIKITEQHLLFLISKGQGELAQKLNSFLIDYEDGKAAELPIMGDLSVKERYALRNDRYSAARVKELTADIGSELKISAKAAEAVLSDEPQWAKLSDPLKKELRDYLVSLQTDDKESSSVLGAKRVTTILQERLKTPTGTYSNWRHEWTLQLPESILEQVVAYFEGEASHWENEKEAQPEVTCPLPKTPPIGLTNIESTPEA